ncbi:MAG: primase-helicase family protein, partial [Bacteriovoracaceae bacterium]
LSEIIYDNKCDARITRVPGRIYSTFNIYQRPEWMNHRENITDIPELYKDFFIHLTNNHQDSYEYLLNWIANSLQSRNKTMLVAVGDQGIGKGILGDILRELHGEENYTKTNDEILKSKFNMSLKYKTVVNIDEINIKNNKYAFNRLKDLINDSIQIEQKGKDQTTIKNTASLYLSTNDNDALPWQDDDRRLSVIELTQTPLKDSPLVLNYDSEEDYVQELLKEENIKALGCYMLTRKINPKEMERRFLCNKFTDLIANNLKDWEYWLINTWIPFNADPNGDKLFTIKEVQDAISNKFPKIVPPGRGKLDALSKYYPKLCRITKNSNKEHVLKILQSTNGLTGMQVLTNQDYKPNFDHGLQNEILEIADQVEEEISQIS